MSCRLNSRRKSMQIYSWEKNIADDAGKKTLTPLYVGEKISNSREVWEKILLQTKSIKSSIPHFPTNVQWSCQPFRGWGKKRIWHLSKCYPSTKWLASIHVVVFKTKVLHFKIENTPIKDTNGKRKFKRMLSFLRIRYDIVFRGIQPCFLRIGALGLFWTNKAARFLRTLEVHSVLYDQTKLRFQKGIFVF